MEQPKATLTSPSLQAPSPHVAGDPVGAASRGSLARSRGAPTDRPANRRYSPPPMPDARAPGCRDNPHPSVASPAASFADGNVDTLAHRSTFVREPADAARMPPHPAHRRFSIDASPPSQPGRSPLTAVDGLVTNSGEQRKHQSDSNQGVHSPEHTWVNSRERQGTGKQCQKRA